MGLKCGIVGLPNVGKSTLFNALTSSSAAAAANYPFCTIEPNSGIVPVPDFRLNEIAKIAKSEKIIPAYIEFVDIAGLVKGASKGEGLGNQFLGHIREVDAIIHVLRCFDDPDITHVHGKVDPVFDSEIIETELVLSDLESIEKRKIQLQKKLKSGDKQALEMLDLFEIVLKYLEAGKPARSAINEIDYDNLKNLQLITSKPILYVCNVLETEASTGNRFTKIIEEKAKSENAEMVIISSKIESEISMLDHDEKYEFLKELHLTEPGLDKIIRQGYKLLNLSSYFTAGPKEARAWTFKNGIKAPGAAGIIHTDFERGFIRAEVISYEDYIKYRSESLAREAGKLRLEGKEYIVKDGDVMHFRFNV